MIWYVHQIGKFLQNFSMKNSKKLKWNNFLLKRDTLPFLNQTSFGKIGKREKLRKKNFSGMKKFNKRTNPSGKIPRTHALPDLLPPKKKKIRSTRMIPSGNTLKNHDPPGLLILRRIQLDRTQKDKDYVTRLYDSSTLCRYQVCPISFMSSSNLLYVFVKLTLSLVNFVFCQK